MPLRPPGELALVGVIVARATVRTWTEIGLHETARGFVRPGLQDLDRTLTPGELRFGEVWRHVSRETSSRMVVDANRDRHRVSEQRVARCRSVTLVEIEIQARGTRIQPDRRRSGSLKRDWERDDLAFRCWLPTVFGLAMVTCFT